MKHWSRWPTVVILVSALVGAAVLDRDPPENDETLVVEPLELQPLAVGDQALGATWYCAGGSGVPGGPADHVVVISNPAQAEVQAIVAGFGSDGESGQVELSVAAGSTQRIRVGDVVEADWVAALVESASGDLVVHHEISGPQGRAASPCASAPSRTWFGAAGATTRDARYLLALFNPFPDRATVEVSFQTDEGVRAPTELERLVVAGRSVKIIEVDQIVTRREQLSTIVDVRAGRVVVDRIQVRTGELGRTGLSLALAAPAASEQWFIPGGLVSTAQQEQLVVYNPGENRAEIDIDILVDDSVPGAVAPLEVTVPSGRFEVVDVTEELARVGLEPPVGHTTAVRSVNGQGVVVDRVLFGAEESMALGVPLAATELVVPLLGSPADPAETTPEGVTTTVSTTTTAPTTTTTTTVASGSTTTAPVDSTTTTTVASGSTTTAPVDSTTTTTIVTTTTSPPPVTTTVVAGPVRSTGSSRQLSVYNPGSVPATVVVTGWFDGSAVPVATDAVVGAASYQWFAIEDLPPGAFLVITADAPIAAEWVVRTTTELVTVSAVATLMSVGGSILVG
ncbi:MAG: hypothetical protein GY713_15035 [Actinomycetia bacterium]|nr:hypothetical protein [Actinomycetes bacterium]